MKSRVNLMVAVTAGILILSQSVFSQEKATGKDKLKASTDKATAAVSSLAPTKEDPSNTRFAELEKSVKNMSENIKAAAEQFEKMTSTSAKDRIVKLETLLSTVNAALAELKEDGAFFKCIDLAIKDAENTMKSYKEKSTDPKISGKTREQYANLSSGFKKTMDSFYDKRKLITTERDNLAMTSKELLEQKDFIGDAMKIDEMKKANEALDNVIVSIKSVRQSMENLAEGILSDSAKGPGKEQK